MTRLAASDHDGRGQVSSRTAAVIRAFPKRVA
jgi:hypothetical protein